MYKLRTIDIWDTLLRRDCHPECIKLATALHLFLGNFNQLKPGFRDYWLLYRARLDAESFLAKEARTSGKDDEYEITQVLTYWLEMVLAVSPEKFFPTRLAEFELQTEIKRSFVDPEINEFLSSYHSEKTLFLSDFYMGAAMLLRLLTAKGLHTLVDNGISSCDIGVNKRSGRLFQYLYSQHGISPAEHLHVGDNQWSDVDVPRKFGATALHFLPKTAHMERLEREKLFSSREMLFSHIHSECQSLAEHTCAGMSVEQAAAFHLGLEVAPLFIAFALWIAEQAVIENLDKIYFFTREGEFFYNIYSAIFQENRFFGQNLPQSRILEVSRQATFVASMHEVSIKEMSRIWSLFKSQNVSGLFTLFGLNIENFSSILNEIGLKADEIVDDPLNNRAIKQLFQNESFINAAKYSIQNKKKFVYAYLEQNRLSENHRVGIVDIGWRGTIQDNLATLVPDTHLHGMYLGLRCLINSQPINVSKSAFGLDENRSSEFCYLFENFAVLEFLCSSKGSVIGYENSGSLIVSQRQNTKEEDIAYEHFVRYFQDGVLFSARHWRSYLERYVLTGGELRKTALLIWEKLRCAPSDDLIKYFMQTPQQDIFCFGDIFQRNKLLSLRTVFLAPVSKLHGRQLVEFVRRIQWTAAIDQAKGMGYFHRWILALIFRVANLIKCMRMRLRLRGNYRATTSYSCSNNSSSSARDKGSRE